jgi:nucleotide-binding universal stress UspA family protein
MWLKEEVTMNAADGSSSEAADARLGERANIFGSVLVGIDGSPEALEAARQASVLTEGRVVLLAAYDIAAALVGGTGPAAPAYYDEEPQRSEAERTLAQARGASERLASAEGRIVRGTSWDELIREIEREQHTLVVVGSHGQGRIKGIVLGSTATEVVTRRRVPCSSRARPAPTSRAGSSLASTARPVPRPRAPLRDSSPSASVPN